MTTQHCPAQKYISDVEQSQAERIAHFAAMTPLQKAEQILKLATEAGKRDDIRGDVGEIAFHLVEELRS